MAELKFAAFSSLIELPFYSALFSSKLDHDKLDDSARFVLGVYEANATATPDESTRLQILGNALTSNTYVARPQSFFFCVLFIGWVVSLTFGG